MVLYYSVLIKYGTVFTLCRTMNGKVLALEAEDLFTFAGIR